jgi:hypothetical protein
MFRSRPAKKLVPAHPAQTRVGDHHEEFFLSQQLQSLFRRFRRPVLIPFFAHDRLERETHVLLVVHDQ